LSKRVSLKDFQESLAGRLKAAAGDTAPSARLSFEAGGSFWLLKLEGSGEVLPVPGIARVPLTRDWFLGVANVRGVLYGVSDFAAFLGRAPTARGGENRILLVGQLQGVNAALLVSRLTGLRNLQKMTPVEVAGEGEDWTQEAWRDPEGRVWRELDATRLIASPAFLDVAAPATH
jgi:twitching motility protein PilI